MLNIEGIHNGIVIDHIKSGSGLKIFNYLRLDKCKTSVALIMNVPSGKIGKKDMIKIENVHDIDLNMLVLIDSNITINVIKNDAIIEKKKLKLPKTVRNLIKCKNPRCITSSEEYVPHIFYLVNEEKGQYRCEYCDELYNMND